MTRTHSQILDEVLDLGATHFGIERAKLAPKDDMFERLQIDSLKALELLTHLENHFGVEIPDYELQGVSDFSALAALIQARL